MEHPRQETFALSFRTWHPTLDMDELVNRLALARYRLCKAGEPRTTPAGRPLEGVYAENFYAADLIAEEEFAAPSFDDSLEACIALSLDRLSPNADYLRSLKAAGAKMEFFVGWTIRSNGGAVISPDLMARMGEWGIALSLDIYGKSTQDEE